MTTVDRILVALVVAMLCVIAGVLVANKECLGPLEAPLTDEQIDTLFKNAERGLSVKTTVRNFARSVERAHGIGENK